MWSCLYHSMACRSRGEPLYPPRTLVVFGPALRCKTRQPVTTLRTTRVAAPSVVAYYGFLLFPTPIPVPSSVLRGSGRGDSCAAVKDEIKSIEERGLTHFEGASDTSISQHVCVHRIQRQP